MNYLSIFLMFYSFLSSQSVQILIDKNVIEKGESITLSIETKNSKKFPNVDMSTLDKDFEILSGPSQQTNIQWINGQMESTKTLTWNVLPLKLGSLYIPSINGEIDGKKFTSKPILVKVKKKSAIKSDNIYIVAEVNKEEVYAGEQITLSYFLYKNVNASVEPFQMPEFTGFWVEDIFTPRRLNYKNKIINGVKYQVANLGQKALFPMTSDDVMIPPLKIKVTIEVNNKKKGRDPFFDPFFDSFFKETKTKFIFSEEKKIKVNELPKPLPKNFTGGIGLFTLNHKVDSDTIKLNEGFIYQISLKGTGNFRLFSLPKIYFPDEIEVFPPETDFERDSFQNEVSGTQTWEYILIPRKSGNIKIPSLNMSYFNTGTKKWSSLNANSLVLKVNGENKYNDEKLINDNSKPIEIARDIRYISDDIGGPKFVKRNFSHIMLTMYSLAFILILVPHFFERFLNFQLYNSQIRKSKNALKIGIKILNNNDQNPHELGLKAFNLYLIQKFDLNEKLLDASKVRSILENNISNSLLERTIQIIRSCEEYKYGGSNTKPFDYDIKREIINIMKNIDKQVK